MVDIWGAVYYNEKESLAVFRKRKGNGMGDKIVIIGSNEHQNPLIVKAKEMGYETHVFAWQVGDAGEKTADFYYPISITDKQAILEKCRQIRPWGIVSMASDLAALTVGYLADALGCIGNPPAVIEGCTNKIRFRKRLRESGIRQPAFVEVGDVFPEEAIASVHFPVVVKPSDRSGNRGVTKAYNRKEMIRALRTAREYSFERKAIIEEFIPGDYYSCECCTENGIHQIMAITERKSVEFQGAFLDYERRQARELTADADVEKTVHAVLEAVGIVNGASSVEYVRNESGVWVIEAMPSMYGDYVGTDLMPLVHGIDCAGKAIAIACGRKQAEDGAGALRTCQSAKAKFVLSKQDYDAYCCASLAGRTVHASSFDEAAYIPEAVTGIQYGYFVEKSGEEA